MHDKNEIELHWLMQTKYFWKNSNNHKKKQKKKEKTQWSFKGRNVQDMSFHTASMISSPQQQPGSQRIQKFSKQAGMEKKIYAKFTLDPTNPRKNKEEKKIEKKNLSPGDGFSSGIVWGP